MVTKKNIDEAFNASKYRRGLYESKLSEMINVGTILIDADGARVGTINGLAVYESGNHSFGKPTRITASVSLGNGNIINVEREAGLSGNTHNKGVLIITGYFRENFGNRIPLSFTASLVFEQGYGIIDGDSASITEICALLSCLADVPIKQSFAITGSVNQKGDIQPIGGVNEKITGFFEICKERGLTGSQGVIIPIQNVSDLMLGQEIIDTVKAGKFHLYSIQKIEEGIDLLLGLPAGEMNEDGTYPPNTVFGKVDARLEELRKAAREQLGKKKKKKAKSNTIYRVKTGLE